jgi:hypothetical protein
MPPSESSAGSSESHVVMGTGTNMHEYAQLMCFLM